MRIFINKTGSVTVVDRILVFELKLKRVDALKVVETHLRGSVEGATEQQRKASEALHATLRCAFTCDCRVGNRHELEHLNDDRMRMHNPNPSGRASAGWAICR